MKIRFYPCLLLSLALHFLGPLPASGAEAPVTLAVFDIQALDDSLKSAALQVGPLINAQLSNEPLLVLVERAEIDKLLGEQELGVSGAITAESAAKIGQLLGARILVTGRLSKSGERLLLVTKIIGTDTGRVFADTASANSEELLEAAVGKLARDIAKRIKANGADLIAAPESAEARLIRLKKLVEGKSKLPSVYVKIPEEHVSRRVPDPAAETEILKTLQELGFAVVSDPQLADFRVTGEAFSEAGAVKGQLRFCRARVEIKVQPKVGAELWVDRESSSGIDVAENVAAKNALQRAGALLAERVVVRLAK